MKNTEFRGHKILVLGLGREGKALARFLSARGAEVTVSDLKSAAALSGEAEELNGLPVHFVLGGHPQTLLDGADAVYVSPGVPSEVPLLKEARRKGVAVESETRLFFSLCRAPIIGITGSSGKSTTTALVGEMLRANRKQVFVGGNIGIPLLENLDQISPRDWVVLELSSFQLETLETSPEIAAILNITPNHLDRHHTMQAYLAAKLNILRYQNTVDTAVLGWDNPTTRGLREECRGRVLFFSAKEMPNGGSLLRAGKILLRRDGEEEIVCGVDEIRLLGEHNLQNVLAACAIASGVGVEAEAMAHTLRGFTGLEHRLELVREVNGVRYYNDSIATSPERSIAALRSFASPVILLAGGREKHLPLSELANLITEKVRVLLLFGEAARIIAGAVEEAKRVNRSEQPEIIYARDLAEAVAISHKTAKRGEVVLLSPACTSFDMYRDFEVRGGHFKSLVSGLRE